MKTNKAVKYVIFIAVLAGSLGAYAKKSESKVSIKIESPANKEKVVERTIVKGAVSRTDATVWVVVHPIELPNYWVQPAVSVGNNGKWNAVTHIGSGSGGIGKTFEIRAFANPKKKLKAGMKLDEWPKAKAKSKIVKVKRK